MRRIFRQKFPTSLLQGMNSKNATFSISLGNAKVDFGRVANAQYQPEFLSHTNLWPC